jgi:hypothetical protein
MSHQRVRMTDLDSQAKRLDNAAQNEAPEAERISGSDAAPGLNARQNAVLRMQQTQGNAAVRRMLVQRAAGTDLENGGPLDDQISSQINSARGSGQTLDTQVADKMGGAMGTDFSDVHVHTDAKSDTLNRQVGAKAFTTGQDIFFSEGTYNPSSGSGQQLLAHELTHVVQQGNSSPSGPLELGPASDSYESEADSVSQTVARMTDDSAVQRDCEDCGDEVQRASTPEDDELAAQA